MIKFESPAERIVYPIINTIAIEKNLKLDYQRKFGFQSGGGFSTKEEWCEENGKYYNGDESNWEDSSWECELYRVDFVLTSNRIKLVVEIDGKEFHTNKLKEESRDKYFKNLGYDILHIPASEIESYKMKDKILERLTKPSTGNFKQEKIT